MPTFSWSPPLTPSRRPWAPPPHRARDLALWSPLFRRDPFVATRRLAFYAFPWNYGDFLSVYRCVLNAARNADRAGQPGAGLWLSHLHAAHIHLRFPGALRPEELDLLWEGLAGAVPPALATAFVRDLFGHRVGEAAEIFYTYTLRRTGDADLALALSQRAAGARARPTPVPGPKRPVRTGLPWLSSLCGGGVAP